MIQMISFEIDSMIPTSRRIGEIMEEKGGAYTIRTFAKRIGICREKLRKIISGERPVRPSELELISSGLGITVARLKQEDVAGDIEELQGLLSRVLNPKRALTLAENLISRAIGITERCNAYNELGRALYIIRRYDQAHDAWMKSYELAQEILEKYEDEELLYRALNNLMISFTVRKEYSNAFDILSRHAEYFKGDPRRTGALTYTKAKVAESQEDFQSARQYAYQSLECFLQTGCAVSIGRAQSTCAHYEYKLKGYHRALELLQSSIQNLNNDEIGKLIAKKDCVKVMLKLKQNTRAIQLIQDSLEELRVLEQPLLTAKFKILLSKALNDPQYAEGVLQQTELEKHIRHIACVYLLEYYGRIGDSFSFLKYYGIAEELSNCKNDVLERDDL
jgi:tetratricopeptide (TPR) repeat protein